MDMSAFIAELEARFDDERGRDLDALIDELTDAERASVTLSARLAGADGDITLALRGGLTVTGSVLDSTRSWVLLRGSHDDSLIMLSAIVAAWPLGRSVARESSVRGGVGVGHVLRELGARGVGVVIESDGGDHRGIIDAVYADHVDVALDGEAFTYDGRDEAGGMTVSLALAGLRRLRVIGQRWSADY
ncbi:MAG: hypothetical protein KHZ98_08110 [Actinomyces sp.]|nr:hypothetical protein [Actinomyces sp.]